MAGDNDDDADVDDDDDDDNVAGVSNSSGSSNPMAHPPTLHCFSTYCCYDVAILHSIILASSL